MISILTILIRHSSKTTPQGEETDPAILTILIRHSSKTHLVLAIVR